MKFRPYLTYPGTCTEAIALYERAFNTKATDVTRFSDIPPNPNNPIPAGFKGQIVQATLPISDDFIRLSDCPGKLNDPPSERVSIAVEATVDEVRHAYEVLSEEGRIGIPLGETFYSPAAAVVHDKFGVMWNFIGQA